MEADVVPFYPPPPYSINVLFHQYLSYSNTDQRKDDQMLHPLRTALRSLAQKAAYHSQLSYACL